MKTASATLFILIGILALVRTASAQSTPMRANIPFDFTVGDKHLDKGEYVIRVESGVVQLSNKKGSGVSSLSYAASPEKSRTKSALVFWRYGDAYFLSKVLQADGAARELPKTRTEIEIARRYSGVPIEAAATR